MAPASSATPVSSLTDVFRTVGFLSDSPIKSRTASNRAELPGRSALFTTQMSPISVIPALMVCMLSPVCGLKTTIVTSAIAAMATSVWPAPTLSTMMGSKPAYSSILMLSRRDPAMAPVAPREAMLRMYIPESVDSVIRTRSPRMAPPVMWLVGSTASTAGLLPPDPDMSTARRFISELFPAPAGPVTPMIDEPPVWGKMARIISRAPSVPFSTIEMARATLPLFPPLSRSISMIPCGSARGQ